jgi:SAM-dependent methyltransferase
VPPSPTPPPPEAEEIADFLEATGIRPGARLLDVPCGIGRRARGLADRGYRVTAVDANAVAIDTLRRRVPKRLAGRIEYRAAAPDALPELAAAEAFDAALCLDHAIGRDAREKDVAFLSRVREHVSPEGLLLVDVLHRDFFASRPRPFAYHVVGEVEQHEFRTFDPLSGVLELTWKFYQREATDLRFRGVSSARLRLLAPHEVEGIFRDAGWTAIARYGGWGKEAVSVDRRKLVFAARPAARS